MSGVAFHLAKRGLDVTRQLATQSTQEHGEMPRVPAWGVALLIATMVTYMAAMIAINYTYITVVSTLAMIETPSATAFKIDISKSGDVDASLLDQKIPESIEEIETEVLLVKAKPITGKIFRTMKHLRAQAGPWARFRGFHIAIIYAMLHHVLFMSLSSFFPYMETFFAGVISAVILCRLQMTLAHVIMSLPSSKSWYRRLPSIKSTKNIIVPTILWAIAEQVAIHVPMKLFNEFRLARYAGDPRRYINDTMEDSKMIILAQLLVVVAAGLITNFLILLPATVTLTRVEASMMPEEQEFIVPFDRSFGGKVQPEILGGSGSVSMLEAWKSFDWAARFRLVKLYVKVTLIELTTSIAFGLIVGAELFLVLKYKNGKL